MRILITGGAGCLGSNLIETWLPRGHEIFVIDNFATGNPEVLPAQPGMTVVKGTVVDRALMDDVFEQFMPTHVVHAAAAYKDPDDWREDVRTNIEGTINVAQASRRFGVERIVYLQTALCYGRPHAVPIPVEHPVAPFTSTQYALGTIRPASISSCATRWAMRDEATGTPPHHAPPTGNPRHRVRP